MVDFHTHILPDMDDGVDTAKEAAQILSVLYQNGFTDVVLSSHYYSNREDMKEYLSRRSSSFAVLKAALEGYTVPRLHLGAEVYLTSLLFNNTDLSPLTLNGKGAYMLTELPYDQKLAATTAANLERLVYVRGITPVLAHIERYPYLLDRKELLPLLEMGCRVQINFRAFTVPAYKRKLKKLVKYGLIDALGTDVHSANGFKQEIAMCVSAVKENYGAEFLYGISNYTKERFIYAKA